MAGTETLTKVATQVTVEAEKAAILPLAKDRRQQNTCTHCSVHHSELSCQTNNRKAMLKATYI